MPVTINEGVGELAKDLTGAPYPNHIQALAYTPSSTFRNGHPSSTGVFPDVSFEGSAIADAFHIHQIARAGVIYKVSVTFLKGSAHVAWAFYVPDSNSNKTFNRFWRGKHDGVMQGEADGAMEEFAAGCPTMPAIAANEAVLKSLGEEAAVKKKLQEQEALAAKSAFAPVVVSSSERDRALFAQATVAASPRTEKEVDAIIAACEKTIKIDPKDLSMVKTALRDRKPKSAWNKFIQPYYDGLLPGGEGQ